MTDGVPVAAIGGRAFWYLTRSSGLVALVLLTLTLVLGVVASVGWTTQRWPRFVSQDVHRNVSLLCLVFVGVHVTTTVADGYVPIGVLDAFLPLHSPYRPVYIGLGALGLDLLLVVLITSALRHRIGLTSWRSVHRLAYLCWPIALLHGLGSGTDARLPVVLAVEAVCTTAVLAAFTWRLSTVPTVPGTTRALAVAGALVLVLALAGFAAIGPLRPGWSHRAGTSQALLDRLAGEHPGAASSGPTTQPRTSPGRAAPGPAGSVPPVPFTTAVTGEQTRTAVGTGLVRVTLAMRLVDAVATPLTVVLVGVPVGTGVSLSSGTIALGRDTGSVTGLDGGTVTGTVHIPAPVRLTLRIHLDPLTGALSGSASASASSGP